jgi:hypothetical protein
MNKTPDFCPLSIYVYRSLSNFEAKTMITPSVSIKLEVMQSDVPVKGNAMASGDDKYDAKVEKQIQDRLNAGDIAAWFDCLLTVSIEWSDDETDYEYEGTDGLGCCNYANVKQFIKESGGYFDDLLETAWDNAIENAHSDGIETAIAKPDLSKIKPVICYC